MQWKTLEEGIQQLRQVSQPCRTWGVQGPSLGRWTWLTGCSRWDWEQRAGSGLAQLALAAVGLGWKAWWDGGSRLLWGVLQCSCVWQPESLGVPLPIGNKPSGRSGPVPEYWCDLQSCRDDSPRPLTGHQVKQCGKAVSSCCDFLITVLKDVSHDFWHLEGRQARVVLGNPHHQEDQKKKGQGGCRRDPCAGDDLSM